VNEVLLLLSLLDFLLSHLEFILSNLEMIGSLQQVRQVGAAGEARQVDASKTIEVADQLTHKIRVCPLLLS
jgi:hypothetical protein